MVERGARQRAQVNRRIQDGLNKEEALHLEKTLKDHYPIKSGWEGEYYIGIDLKWDYEKQSLKTSINGNIKKVLFQFQHEMSREQYSDSQHFPIRYKTTTHPYRYFCTHVKSTKKSSHGNGRKVSLL